MSNNDTQDKIHCHEYADVECELGTQYPYCDMFCPMNHAGAEIISAHTQAAKHESISKSVQRY